MPSTKQLYLRFDTEQIRAEILNMPLVPDESSLDVESTSGEQNAI